MKNFRSEKLKTYLILLDQDISNIKYYCVDMIKRNMPFRKDITY